MSPEMLEEYRAAGCTEEYAYVLHKIGMTPELYRQYVAQQSEAVSMSYTYDRNIDYTKVPTPKRRKGKLTVERLLGNVRKTTK